MNACQDGVKHEVEMISFVLDGVSILRPVEVCFIFIISVQSLIWPVEMGDRLIRCWGWATLWCCLDTWLFCASLLSQVSRGVRRQG